MKERKVVDIGKNKSYVTHHDNSKKEYFNAIENHWSFQALGSLTNILSIHIPYVGGSIKLIRKRDNPSSSRQMFLTTKNKRTFDEEQCSPYYRQTVGFFD